MVMILAVAYYRMSSDKQETSIADQRTAVEEYAAAHNYNIVREYLDEGITGWKAEQRKGFQRLIEDANSREFQAVLCWDQDRFRAEKERQVSFFGVSPGKRAALKTANSSVTPRPHEIATLASRIAPDIDRVALRL